MAGFVVIEPFGFHKFVFPSGENSGNLPPLFLAAGR